MYYVYVYVYVYVFSFAHSLMLFLYLFQYIKHITTILTIVIFVSSSTCTAQAGGGSFSKGNLYGILAAADGLKSGWSCVCFWNGYNGCSGHLVGHLTHNCWKWCGVARL